MPTVLADSLEIASKDPRADPVWLLNAKAGQATSEPGHRSGGGG